MQRSYAHYYHDFVADAERAVVRKDSTGLPNLFILNLFIIVFGRGGGRRGGCSGPGCLFWILISVALSVGLTVLVNLIALLLSSPAPGVPGVDF